MVSHSQSVPYTRLPASVTLSLSATREFATMIEICEPQEPSNVGSDLSRSCQL